MADEGDASEEGDEGTGDQGGDEGSGKGTDETDWKAEAEKWKALSQKHEGRAKSNVAAARELDQLKKATQTDTEKAVSEAEERGRQAARVEAAERLAGAEIKAALAGIVPEPATIVEDLKLAKYLTEDGEVDDEKVAALKAKYEALAVKPKKISGSADGGSQGGDGGKPKQLSQADLKSMNPDQIVAARAKGQLVDLMGGKT